MKPAIPFNVFYETRLLPTLTELEGDRKKLVNALFIYIAVALAVAIPLWFVMMFLALIPFAVAAVVYFVKYNDTINEKKNAFKREVIGKMIAFLDDSLTYEPKGATSTLRSIAGANCSFPTITNITATTW